MKKFSMLIALFLLFGCAEQETKPNTVSPAPDNEIPNKDNSPIKEETFDFSTYFMPTNTTAYFEGYGNEYASYTLKTTWLNDQYVATVLDNGGATVLRIYRLANKQVELIDEHVVDVPMENITYPTIEQLEGRPTMQVYLAAPIKKGTTFGNWTIIETNTTLETPLQKFEDVFVIEETGDGFTNRHYFAPGYGEIKREAIMDHAGENEEPFIVSSTIKTVEYVK